MPGTKTHHALSQQVAGERQRVFDAIMKARPLWNRDRLAAYTAELSSSELVELRNALEHVADLNRRFGSAVPRGTTIPAVAKVLAKLLSTNQVADLLNVLLGCDAEPSLDDDEAALGEAIFDQLCLLRPEAVAVAQNQ